jgi:hypothetical protein
VAGDVLPEERRVDSVGNGDAVLHNAFRDVDEDAVSTVTGVELCTCQAAGQQRDDDDRDEDDRLPIEESPAASLLGSRRLRVGRRSGWGTGRWRRRRCRARWWRRWLSTARRCWRRLDTARRRWRPEFLGRCCVRRLPARTDLFGRWFSWPVRTLDPARCGVLLWVAPALPTGPPGTLRRRGRRRSHLRDSASSSRIHPVNLGERPDCADRHHRGTGPAI